MRKRLSPVWFQGLLTLGLLTLGLLIISACTAQTPTLNPSPAPTDESPLAEPADPGQLQFIEFYSPL